jgi:hypothetical protein
LDENGIRGGNSNEGDRLGRFDGGDHLFDLRHVHRIMFSFDYQPFETRMSEQTRYRGTS